MTVQTIRGVDLAYEVLGSGDGTPFVWGHGLTSSRAGENEFPLVDLPVVAESRRVLRYDAAGHGGSGALPNPERGGWGELALDQIELIDHLGYDEVVLGGASMGTGTALHAALKLGARVRGLVLVIPPTGWETRQAQVGMYEQMASIIDAKGVEPLIDASATMPPPDPFVGSSEYRERGAARMRAADPARLAACFRGAQHAQLPARNALSQLEIPTLVLAWSGDTGHPVSTADELGRLLPNCAVAIASTAEELATWTDRVVAFLGNL